MPSVLDDAKIALQMLDKAHKKVMGDTENPAATGNHHAALFGMAIAAGVEVLLRAETITAMCWGQCPRRYVVCCATDY